MYYHGLEKFGVQSSRVATSNDGINFIAENKIIGKSYFRKFGYESAISLIKSDFATDNFLFIINLYFFFYHLVDLKAMKKVNFFHLKGLKT